MAFQLSEHAKRRCEERQVPEEVLDKINDRAFLAQARETDGRLSNYHIVRVRKRRYWVAIERDGVIITVIPVDFPGGSTPRNWFRRRLLNFRHLERSLQTMAVTPISNPVPTESCSVEVEGTLQPRRNWSGDITSELARHYGVEPGLVA